MKGALALVRFNDSQRKSLFFYCVLLSPRLSLLLVVVGEDKNIEKESAKSLVGCLYEAAMLRYTIAVHYQGLVNPD